MNRRDPRTAWFMRGLPAVLLALILAAGCTRIEPQTRAATTPAAVATTAAAGAKPPVIPAAGLTLSVPLLHQADPRWKDVKLGGSGPGIGAEGCALTCFAMVSTFYGIPTTPAQANERLGKYAYPLEWVAGESRYDLRVQRKDCIRFRDSRLGDNAYVHDTIEDCLASGLPVIIGILQTTTGTPHFIVAYGLEPAGNGKYRILVRDPSMNSNYLYFEDIPAGWIVTRLVVYQA
jgi:hypothetical protein